MHSPSVVTVENEDSITLPPLEYPWPNEMDITDIVDLYTLSEESFGSVDALETPRMAQTSIPDVAIYGSREFAPPLRELEMAVGESSLVSESSPSDVAGTLQLLLKARARQLSRSGTTPADMGVKSGSYVKTPRIGPFLWEAMQCADVTEERWAQ